MEQGPGQTIASPENESGRPFGEIKPLGWRGSIIIFIPAALLMFVQTHFIIPYLEEQTGLETAILWFIVGSQGVFLPLILLGWVLLKEEGFALTKSLLKTRCRFRKLTRKDIEWALWGLILVNIWSVIIMTILEGLWGNFNHTPPFMAFDPLKEGRYWLLMVWFFYWIFNILGEEFLWRGVMLPRQEVSFGSKAWIIQAIGWGIFHIAFGLQLLITLLPMLIVLPYVTQKTKNSWVAVILHAGLNGTSFIAIAFGWI